MTVVRIVSGGANPGLACTVERYPDGELRPVVENVCSADVYVVQLTGPRVNEHLVELLLLLDACRDQRPRRFVTSDMRRPYGSLSAHEAPQTTVLDFVPQRPPPPAPPACGWSADVRQWGRR